MTRAMVAQVLANLYGADLSQYVIANPRFNDVSQENWYFAPIQWAYSNGLVLGVGGGNFAPAEPVTREQLAVLLERFASAEGASLPVGYAQVFIDAYRKSYWAVEAIRSIQDAGLIRGRPDGRFDPQAIATRAEVAAIFARYLLLR